MKVTKKRMRRNYRQTTFVCFLQICITVQLHTIFFARKVCLFIFFWLFIGQAPPCRMELISYRLIERHKMQANKNCNAEKWFVQLGDYSNVSTQINVSGHYRFMFLCYTHGNSETTPIMGKANWSPNCSHFYHTFVIQIKKIT